MPTIVFYEMPPSAHWSAVAQLVLSLLKQGRVSVVVSSDEEAGQLSRVLWALPPSQLVPHGIDGRDADAEMDPVVISVGEPLAGRPVVVQASGAPKGAACSAELVAEVVPGDESLRGASRTRFKSYKERGLNPSFVAWETWASSR